MKGVLVMNQIEGWQDYSIALIPTTPPHENPKLENLNNQNLWKSKRFLVRYTTDFDCGHETNWWHLIKDDEMDISSLKKKRRYEINSGLNNFDVKKISSKEFAEQIYLVHDAAFKNYKTSEQGITKEDFIAVCLKHHSKKEVEYYGAFDKESGELAAYAINIVYEEYVNFSSMKFTPKYLTKKVSAALVFIMLVDYLNTQKKKYVSDGERSIRHITNFQDYLIKYFGFRKAYCKLNIQYRPTVNIAVKTLYPFRNIIKKVSNNISPLSDVSSLLDMEQIRRSF